MSSKPRAKGEKGLESHLLHWAKHIYSGATGRHTQGLCWMPPCWLDAFWLCEASCLLPPNIKLYNAGCYGFHGLTPCFSLPIFQAHLPKAQAWLSPNLQFCLGLAAEGRADSPHPPKLAVILNRGEAPGLCLGLPRKHSLQGQRSPCFIAPGCALILFVSFYKFCAIPINQPLHARNFSPVLLILHIKSDWVWDQHAHHSHPQWLVASITTTYTWALEGCLWSVWVGLWLMLLPQRAYHLKMGI